MLPGKRKLHTWSLKVLRESGEVGEKRSIREKLVMLIWRRREFASAAAAAAAAVEMDGTECRSSRGMWMDERLDR